MLTTSFAIAVPHSFFTVSNLQNILSQNAVMLILGSGLTLVVLLGEIDLSFPGIIMITGAAAGLFFYGTKVGVPLIGYVAIASHSPVLCVVLAILIGVLLGLLNGGLVAGVGVPSFIGSLAVLLLAEGWAYYWLNGKTVYNFPAWILTLGQGSWGPVPIIAVCAAIVALLVHLVLSRTVIGRFIYMTGASQDAARLSGINTRRVRFLVLAFAGFIAAIAGMAYAGRYAAIDATSGPALLLPTFAAVVLGGNSLFGGAGGIKNTVVGVLLYGVLGNGLLLLNVNIFALPFLEGMLLVVAVVLNVGLSRLARLAARRVSLRNLGMIGDASPSTSCRDLTAPADAVAADNVPDGPLRTVRTDPRVAATSGELGPAARLPGGRTGGDR